MCYTRSLKLKTQRYDKYLKDIRLQVTIMQQDWCSVDLTTTFSRIYVKIRRFFKKFIKKVFDKLKWLDMMFK